MSSEIPPGTPNSSERSCERKGDVVDFGGNRIGTGPCVDRDGRPLAHGAYVYPSRRNPLLRFSAVTATLVAATLIGVYFAGRPARPGQTGPLLRVALAPAATFSRHSLATFDCVQCHREGHKVEDVRCERCHDSSVSGRLTNAAHVFQGTGDLRRALDAPMVQCTTCHVEHRGQDVILADVDDRECGACHRTDATIAARLTSLARHPEFAAVRMGVDVGNGLRWFNHKMHLQKVEEKLQKGCEGCHERPSGAASFNEISFARHCAICHEPDLSTSAATVPASVLTAFGRMPATLATRVDPDDPTRRSIEGITHADPWLLRTVQSLRRAADPGAVAAERLTLDRDVAQLELMLKFGSTPQAAWTGLDRAAAPRFAGSIPAQATSADAAMPQAAAEIEAFAKSIGSLDPSAATLAADAARHTQGAPPKPAVAGVADSSLNVDSLRQLIDATVARAQAAGDQSVLQRATALRGRLDQVTRGGATPRGSAAGTSTLEALLRDLRTLPDAGVRSDVDQAAALASAARQQATGGVNPTAFDLHRRQTLQLLDSVEQALRKQLRNPGDAARVDGLIARVDSLRRDVLATYYGLPEDISAARARFLRMRQADRARLDDELTAADLRLQTAMGSELGNGARLDRRLAQLRARLAALGTAPDLASPIPAGDARRAISALLGREAGDADENILAKNRCTLCHELTSKGDQLAPVRGAGGPVLVSSTFTHDPHVVGTSGNCTTCHTGIAGSTAAHDLNIPGIDSCRTCHVSGGQAARAIGCESCHRYHASSRSALMWMP